MEKSMKLNKLLFAGLLTFSLVSIGNAADSNTSSLTVTDADGNVYHTVVIGTQTWTVENLKTTKFNDGTSIPEVTDQSDWNKLWTPAYCWYDNDSVDNKNTYGALYTWYAVHTGKLAPEGWHVPTDAEWDTLQNYLISHGYNYDGTKDSNKIAKSVAAKNNWPEDSTTGVIGNNVSANNRSGFSALPGGYRENHGYFSDVGKEGYWWSATENSSPMKANFRNLSYDYYYLNEYYTDENSGCSVRLVKD
jgi:uncharacterized protein (TIGR02145 family)